MQLTNDFTVPVDIDRLWVLLNDVEQIAPCVPGFTLVEANHPDYRGKMKVKVGAITVQYDATITFAERDEAQKRVVLLVRGKELRGAGSVDATVTSSLVAKGTETTAEMVTDVQVTGRVAQFGRGIIADVSSRMTEQFVDRLNTVLTPPAADANGQVGAAGTEPAAAQPPPPLSAVTPDDDALDLGSVAAVPVLKRVGPPLAGLIALAIIVRLVRRR